MSLFWGLVVVVVADAIAIAAMLLVRRRAPEGSYFTDGDRASGVFGMLATGFAIFAGFVIFLAFTTYDDSRRRRRGRGVGRRAAVRDGPVPGSAVPGIDCPASSSATGATSSTTSGRGWRPATSETPINPWAVALFRTIRNAAHVDDVPQQTAFAKWLDQTSDREEARRDRDTRRGGHHADDGVDRPSTDRGVVFVYMLFFADSAEMKRSQAMLIARPTTVVVVTLLAIHALDNPYRRGLGSIRPRWRWSAR